MHAGIVYPDGSYNAYADYSCIMGGSRITLNSVATTKCFSAPQAAALAGGGLIGKPQVGCGVCEWRCGCDARTPCSLALLGAFCDRPPQPPPSCVCAAPYPLLFVT